MMLPEGSSFYIWDFFTGDKILSSHLHLPVHGLWFVYLFADVAYEIGEKEALCLESYRINFFQSVFLVYLVSVIGNVFKKYE